MSKSSKQLTNRLKRAVTSVVLDVLNVGHYHVCAYTVTVAPRESGTRKYLLGP